MSRKKEKTIIYLIIFFLAISLVSFNSVFAQGKMFLQKKPDFNVDLQQPSQAEVLEKINPGNPELRKKCIAAIEKHSWSAHAMLEDIGTLLGVPPAGIPSAPNPIAVARDALERHIGPEGCIGCTELQAIVEIASTPINGRRASSLFRQMGSELSNLGNEMREYQTQVVAFDEQLNQMLFQLTGQELANQFIEDSQGSCGLTPENSPWVGDPQR